MHKNPKICTYPKLLLLLNNLKLCDLMLITIKFDTDCSLIQGKKTTKKWFKNWVLTYPFWKKQIVVKAYIVSTIILIRVLLLYIILQASI